MKKVVKFGGSSLASAEQFMKVGAIIRQEESRRYVVPSAPGKRFSDDTKVTDMLYHCYELAEQSKAFNKQLNQIKDRYNEIIYGLKLDLSLDEDFELYYELKLENLFNNIGNQDEVQEIIDDLDEPLSPDAAKIVSKAMINSFGDPADKKTKKKK